MSTTVLENQAATTDLIALEKRSRHYVRRLKRNIP